MTNETKTIEELTRTAKATLLAAIAEAAEDEGRFEVLESLSRSFAAVAVAGPNRGEVPQS